MSTPAVMHSHSLVQTPIFSVSPSSFSLHFANMVINIIIISNVLRPKTTFSWAILWVAETLHAARLPEPGLGAGDLAYVFDQAGSTSSYRRF